MPNNRVFILGAGASSPYGFPLGVGLRDAVCQKCLKPPGPMLDLGFDEAAFSRFGGALAHSGYSSVDWFLERHSEFRAIGRIAIAAALIPFERPEKLFAPGAPPQHWYEILANLMWSDDTQSYSAGAHLVLLTFNYDRSLEHYLLTVAATRTGLIDGAATLNVTGPHRTIVAQGPTIIHLHGQLGYLGAGPEGREYSRYLTPEGINTAARKIKVLSEADDSSVEFAQARAAIATAAEVCFLGFGFHPTSVRRLADFGDAAAWEGKRVTGTNAGIAPPRWAAIAHDLLGNRWQRSGVPNGVHGFIEQYPWLA